MNILFFLLKVSLPELHITSLDFCWNYFPQDETYGPYRTERCRTAPQVENHPSTHLGAVVFFHGSVKQLSKLGIIIFDSNG